MTYDLRKVTRIKTILTEWFSAQGHQVDSSVVVIQVECDDGENDWIEEETIDLQSLAEHIEKELN